MRVCKIFVNEDVELRRGEGRVKELGGSRAFSKARWKEETKGEVNKYYGRKEQAVSLPGFS